MYRPVREAKLFPSLLHPPPLESMAKRVSAATQSSVMKTEAGKREIAACLRDIARMYKSSPEARASLTELRERINVCKTWVDLDLPPAVLETDYESVRFLVKERLIFCIVGLMQASSFGKDQIRVESGKISIQCEGKFVPVSSLIDRFEYAKDDLQYRERDTKLAWNYVLPGGLITLDRCKTPEMVPTTQLDTSGGRAINILLTPVRWITNFFLKLMLMGFGASRGSPMKENLYAEPSNPTGMRKFFAIISSPKDLFTTPTLYHSGPIIGWQEQQKTTCFYTYSKPSMNVLPGKAPLPSAKKRPYDRYASKIATKSREKALADTRRQFFHNKVKMLGKKK